MDVMKNVRYCANSNLFRERKKMKKKANQSTFLAFFKRPSLTDALKLL